MAKKQFKAESKRLLEMMINSIYTQKEIFLRELLSNASDAMDKIYYKALSDDQLVFNKEDYFIKISIDKNARTVTITDTGIGMTKEELDNNLGVIAKSGSLAFKSENEAQDGHNIIGQFGVGFYSAFMVADKLVVTSRALGSDEAYRWISDGADGYVIESAEKATVGTEIVMHIKENTEDEQYDEYLEQYRLKAIVKKYSDFIRYPIKMDIASQQPKADSEGEFEEVVEEQVLNSMVPLWRRNKNELTDDDYNLFYMDKRYGFDKPLKHVHISADGAVVYNAILFLPENPPYDFYTKEYEKGLELYSNGVLIMEKCSDLLPDYFGFVKGMVDSEDLSLNISRELLQHDRQLKLIAKNIKNKIKSMLQSLLKDERESYEKFYASFGRQLKFGVYNDYGMNKGDLQDLLLFTSSKDKQLVTLAEYVERMSEDQKYIYYATGESVARIEKSPQLEVVLDKGYEVLYLTDDIDEFALKVIQSYNEKEFRSISSGDLGFDVNNSEDHEQAETEETKELFAGMQSLLDGKVKSVKASKRLKSHPVCLSSEGELSIEMEKILKGMPDANGVQADKVLEININHDVFRALQQAYSNDQEKFGLYTQLLYSQALLIEGLSIEDPVELSNNICRVMV
ncbi:MAG: molecular chaperone HtpG [Candidatus Pristimantibacillus lignocellulolyticus]|uniref:Chaperone protein HtpG n=1 Tax=Candidatus Pristimantibacillus lignocellulolyticus TaxID=2994561 RepID=A0A9J6ZFL4_9BACL|nr:MAG: molecular chaperone HtpG [Candidatus Pristimantibacillus lignocellulolyticus]